MAQNDPYNIQDIPMQALDYNFLNMSLQKRGAEFAQGQNEVRSMYQGILNAPLSNGENQQARDQYMSEAQESLKALSKSDLSLPGNVSQASKVFSPFWTDQDILQDVSTTKQVQVNQQEINEWKNSKDKDVFSRYNPIQEEYNQQTITDLQRAHRGDGSIAQATPRKVIAYKDKMQYLRDAADKSGYEIEYDYVTNADGTTSPYIKKVTNGAETMPNWKVWADSALGDNFQEQDKMFGQVAVDRYKNHFLQENPNISEKEVNQKIAQDVLPTYTELYNKRFDEYKDTISNFDARIQEIKDQAIGINGKARSLSSGESAHIDQYTQNKAIVENLQKKLTTEQPEIFNNNRDKVVERIAKNPLQYFTDLEHERATTNFAKGITALGSTEIEANPVWATELQNKYQIADLNQKWRIAQMNNNTTLAGIGEEHFGHVLQGIEKGILGPDGKMLAPGSTPYISKDITDQTQLPGAYDAFKNDQTEIYTKGVAKIADYQGVAGALSNKTIGMRPDEITQACESIKKWSHPDSGPLSMENRANLQNLRTKLSNAGVNVPWSVEGFVKGIETFAQKESKRKDLTEIEKTHVEDKVLAAGLSAENDLNEYKANETARAQAFGKELINNPKLRNVVSYRDEYGNPIDRSKVALDILSGKIKPSQKDGSIIMDGKKYVPDIMTATEISKRIGSDFSGKDNNWMTPTTLKSDEIASAYRKGTLDYNLTTAHNGIGSNTAEVKVDGKTVILHDQEAARFVETMKSLEKSIGKPSQYKDIEKDINEKVVNQMPKYANSTGRFGTVLTYSSSNPAHEKFVRDAGIELAAPSNQLAIYNTDSKHTKVEDPETRSALQQILLEGDHTDAVAYHNKSFDGSNMWEVHLGSVKTAKGSTAPTTTYGTGKKDISNFQGQSYLIKVDPETNSKLLKNFPQNNNVYSNQDLLDGKTKQGSAYLSSAGFPFTITPNKPNPDYYIVNVNPMSRDSTSGNWAPAPPQEQIFDAATTDPDKLYNQFLGVGLKWIDNNNRNLKLAHKTQQ